MDLRAEPQGFLYVRLGWVSFKKRKDVRDTA